MQADYCLERPNVPEAASVWDPIFDLLDKLLLELGLTPSRTSNFRLFPHADKLKSPEATLYVMQMHLTGLYSVDTTGWGVSHSAYADRSWEAEPLGDASTFCTNLAKEFLSTGVSKCGQPPMAAPEWDDYVLVPLQMPNDSVIDNHSPVSVKEFVQQVGEWSAKTQTRVLMKVHPGHVVNGDSTPSWAAEAAQCSPYLRTTTGNIHSLLANCNAVLVINSGVGFEALIHGKPVITVGQCDYDQATTRGNLATLSADLESALRRSPDGGYRFAYHYLGSRCYWLSRDPLAHARLKSYLQKVVLE